TRVMINGYLVGLLNATSALNQRIRELKSREYPTQLSKKLLDVIEGAVDILSNRFEQAHSAARLGGEDIRWTSIQRSGQLLRYLHELVHLVAVSAGNEVPRWAIRPMKYETLRLLEQTGNRQL